MRVPFSVKACAVVAGLLVVAVAPVPAEAAAKDVSALDRAFVDAAGHAGAYEVAAGKVAVERATSSALRSFGRQMVRDHTKAGDELAALAEDLGLDAPDKPDSVQRAIIGIWSGLPGVAFDCSYGPAAYADHGAAVGLFEREAADGLNSRLRAFAKDTLPTLREHLAMAATNVKGLSCDRGNSNDFPTVHPSPTWTYDPDPGPTMWPTHRPTHGPTYHPTSHPTTWPTDRPRHTPTTTPTTRPTPTRTVQPTPTRTRTTRPTVRPTRWPTVLPTILPTLWPTRFPTLPAVTLTVPTDAP